MSDNIQSAKNVNQESTNTEPKIYRIIRNKTDKSYFSLNSLSFLKQQQWSLETNCSLEERKIRKYIVL